MQRRRVGSSSCAAAPSQTGLHSFVQVPLQAPSAARDPDSEADEAETPEQVLMRRTREFNVALRESPHRLQLWLDYAEFQEEVVRWVMAPARASRPRVAVVFCPKEGVGKCAGALPGVEPACMSLHRLVLHQDDHAVLQERLSDEHAAKQRTACLLTSGASCLKWLCICEPGCLLW